MEMVEIVSTGLHLVSGVIAIVASSMHLLSSRRLRRERREVSR